MVSKIKTSPFLLILFASIVLITVLTFPATFRLSKLVFDEYRILLECWDSGRHGFMRKVDCYSMEFKSLASKNNFDYTLEVLRRIRDKDRVVYQCHFAAHEIAEEEAKKDPANWQRIARRLKPLSCAGGFVAGAMRVALLGSAKPQFTLDKARDFCASFENISGKQECSHGMGHILLVKKNGDVFEAIEGCKFLDTVLNKEEGSVPCYRGVFMEDFLRDNLKSHGLMGHLAVSDEGANQAESVCAKFEGEVAFNCWRELPHFYVILDDFNFEKVFDRCDLIPMSEARLPCAVHAISWLGAAVDYNLEKMTKICLTAARPNGIKEACTEEFLRLIFLFGKNPIEIAGKFCAEFGGDEEVFCRSKYQEKFSRQGENYYDLEVRD